jgi:hypothetical protein
LRNISFVCISTTRDRSIINIIYSDLTFFTLAKTYTAVSYVTALTEEYCCKSFGGAFCLHDQGQKVGQTRKKREAWLVLSPASCWLLRRLLFNTEVGVSMFLRMVGDIILDFTPLEPRSW